MESVKVHLSFFLSFISIFYIKSIRIYIVGYELGSRILYKLNNIIFFSRSVKKF